MAPRLSSLSHLDRTSGVRAKSPLTRLVLLGLLGATGAACSRIEVDDRTSFVQVPVNLARDANVSADQGNQDASEMGVDAGTDAVMPSDMTVASDVMTSPDVVTSSDVTNPPDADVGSPVDVPVDTGPRCTPTSVVIGNDNVIVAAHGNNVPVVINFNGECPTLGSGAVQARISSAGAPFPMFGITMNTLESSRARGVMNLTTPELVGFPLNTYMARDGIDNALTGNMFPAGFTLPVNFVVDRVPPVMTSISAASFDRNAGLYNFSFMGDSNGKVIFDVRTVAGDAGASRSLLTHGTRTPCTLSRGAVAGRSDSTGCGSDSLGEAQSCVYVDGTYSCESNRLMFPITASVRASNTLQDRDYHAVIDTITTPRTPLTFVWTYQDDRGNTTTGTRSIMMLN
jgi:hypothetical protein